MKWLNGYNRRREKEWEYMETHTGIFFIIGILAVVLLIGILRSRAELLINFFLRGISGMLVIYLLNFFLESHVPTMEVGYNIVTFLTSAFLGFPGVAALYGIIFYMLL